MVTFNRAFFALERREKMDANAMTSVGSGFLVFYYIFAIALSVLSIIATWKLFTKAGEAGWKSIIPVYNGMVLFKIIYGKPGKYFMVLIPVFGEILAIASMVRLGQVYGKGVGFRLGLIFLSPVFLLILGFGDSQYIGPVDSTL